MNTMKNKEKKRIEIQGYEDEYENVRCETVIMRKCKNVRMR